MEIAKKINEYNYDIVTLQEVRWLGAGSLKKKDFTLNYSEPEKRTILYETGFITSTKIIGS